jgi:succinate dehydrogenase / fumarate reductase flavoprotein subunit
VVDEGKGVGPLKNGVYLDFAEARERIGASVVYERYSNLMDMYQRITDEDPMKVPMRIYPAVHYTMGGLWVNYELMSNLDGLFVVGEANFSDHGANRLGASALMQGLADGYFVLPYTLTHWLAGVKPPRFLELSSARALRGSKTRSSMRIRSKRSSRARSATDRWRFMGAPSWRWHRGSTAVDGRSPPSPRTA